VSYLGVLDERARGDQRVWPHRPQRLRAARERGAGFEIVAVNDLTSAAPSLHLLKYDSVHGKYPDEVSATDDGLMVAGNRVAVLSERDPAALPWADMGVEIVLESTGFFTKREGAAKHSPRAPARS